jgi:hypothetical protein
MDAGTISPVAVLRDARKSALLRTRLIGDIDVIRTSKTLYEPLRFNIEIKKIELEIGIGGSLTTPPLPHHRAYGSVHGGSVD